MRDVGIEFFTDIPNLSSQGQTMLSMCSYGDVISDQYIIYQMVTAGASAAARPRSHSFLYIALPSKLVHKMYLGNLYITGHLQS
jgi:hypothetical protein